MRSARRLFGLIFRAAGLVASLSAAACGRSEAPARQASGPSPSAPGAEERAGASRVMLSPEAIRQARITTEVIHQAPFAETLSAPARLSPVAETPGEIEARLAFQAAEARYRKASAELERVRRLAADNVVASKTVQSAEAEFTQASVEKARAEMDLRNHGIDAQASAPSNDADIWALADLYDAQVPRVKAGARAWVRVESYPGETFEGRVVSLAKFLKPQTRTLTVRVAVRDPRHRLRAQEPATVEIEVARGTALSVPASAILYEGDDRILFVKRGGAFEMVRVRTGPRQADRVKILDGLADGDEVVTHGAQNLLGEMYKTRIPAGEEGAEEEERERD